MDQTGLVPYSVEGFVVLVPLPESYVIKNMDLGKIRMFGEWQMNGSGLESCQMTAGNCGVESQGCGSIV
jgi:hypothetical protein